MADLDVDRPDPDRTGKTVLEDFAPGETSRFRESWSRTDRIVKFLMALGPVFGVLVLVTPVGGEPLFRADPVKGFLYTIPIVLLYEAILYRFFKKNRGLLEGYAGWDLTDEGIVFPVRRNKETKDLERRFVPYDAVDAVYFEGTTRLVSLVWPTMPDHVRAEYGEDVPRALDDYVVVVETDETHTAIEKDDVDDVEALKEALRERDVKVVG